MAVGTNNYTIALVSTAMIITVIYYLTKKHFGMIDHTDHLLTLEFPSRLATDKLMAVFKASLTWHQLANLLTFDKQDKLEMTYNIKLKPQVNPADFLKELKKIKGVDKLHLVCLEDQAVN